MKRLKREVGAADGLLFVTPEYNRSIPGVLKNRVDHHVQNATLRAERLSQSILARAFRGELVPTEAQLARREGRDYEPASLLLERVRTNRESAPHMPRRRKRRAITRAT